MQEYEQSVFISYSWGGESEEIVNQIDKALQQRGLKIIRDKRDLGYKGSISAFMEQIGQGACVIVVISDKYLRSPNCMFELVEIAEGKQFHDRVFPIVLSNAEIYDPVKRLQYVKHWEMKRGELAQAIKEVDPANLQGIREDMDLYDRIRDKIAGLTSILKDMNTLTPDRHKDSDFSEIFIGIERRMADESGLLKPKTGKTPFDTPLESGTKRTAKFENHTAKIDEVQSFLVEPRIPGHFKDRSSEIQRLVHLISEQKWCGVFGMGGTGKTILAARVARQIRKSATAQVVWLRYHEEASVEQILETLAQAIGHSLRSIADANQRDAFLRGVTEDKGLFIVFDDVNDDIVLTTLLDSVGSGNAVLITSRDQGLKSINKFGLEVVSLEPLPVDASTELLLQLSGASQPTLSNTESWQELARAVGNLPLALEVIAGEMRFRSDPDPEAYLISQVSTGRWLKNEEVQERLYGTLRKSIELLPLHYRKAFACLGMFSGNGFELSAVRAICGFDSKESAEGFLAAMRKLMLVSDRSAGIFSLHPAIKEFAREQLSKLEIETQKQDSPVGAYLAFYLLQLQNFGGYEWNISQYTNLVPHEIEVLNAINIAYRLWTNQANTDRDLFGRIAIEMTFYVSWYLNWRGYWDLRIQLCQQITDELKKLGLSRGRDNRYSNIAGNLYVDQGWIHLWRCEYDKTRYCVEQAKPLIGLGDSVFVIELEAQLALKTGDAQKSYEFFSEIRNKVPVYTRSWFVFSYRLSDSLVELGKDKEALDLLGQLLKDIPKVQIISREIISDTHACIAYRLAKLLKGTQIQASKELLEESVQLFQDSGIIDQTSVEALIELADILHASNMDAQSIILLNKGLKQARTIGQQDLVNHIENVLRSTLNK
jgi:hypothetical protein